MGIRVFAACGGSEIEDLTIRNNSVKNSGIGIRVNASRARNDLTDSSKINNLLIENNTIQNIYSDSDGGFGIHVQSGYSSYGDGVIRKVEIDNNDISDTGGNGIRVYLHGDDIVEEDIIITYNTIDGTMGDAIRAHASDGNSLNKIDASYNTIRNVNDSTVPASASLSKDLDSCKGQSENINKQEATTSGDVDHCAKGIRVHLGHETSVNNVSVNNNEVDLSSTNTTVTRTGIRVHTGRYSNLDSLNIGENDVDNTNGYGIGIKVHAGRYSVIGYTNIDSNDVEYEEGSAIRLSACAFNFSDGAGSAATGVIESADIVNNIISGNDIVNSHGIYVYTGDNCRDYTRYGGLLENITIAYNEVQHSDYGILLEANNDGEIDGVDISNNTLSNNENNFGIVEDSGGEVINVTADFTF